MSSLRIVFAGTPEFAAHHLQCLLDSEHQVVGVYSQPDRPAGRGRKLSPSPVKALALEHEITVCQPLSLKGEEEQQILADFEADVMVVVAYGLLLPKSILDTPRLACINVHGSLLPRWRGAAPIQRAIAAGDDESGVTIMHMDIGLDTGDMLVKARCPIHPTDCASDLHDRLQEIGGPALLETLDQLSEGRAQGEKQDDAQANYAHKMSKEEARLDFNQSALQLDRTIRAFNPWPVAYTEIDNQRVRVWGAQLLTDSQATQAPGTIEAVSPEGIDVACGEGLLRLQELQFSGAKRLGIRDLLNSRRDLLQVGLVLGSEA